MGKVYDGIDERLRDWVARQSLFFTGTAPRIVRFHGRGEVIRLDDPRFGELLERCAFEETAVPEARRAIVLVDVTRVADSCGYGVPLMSYEGERPHQEASAAKRARVGGPDAFDHYMREKNASSIDGLPAVDV